MLKRTFSDAKRNDPFASQPLCVRQNDAKRNDPFAALLVILRYGKNTCNT